MQMPWGTGELAMWVGWSEEEELAVSGLFIPPRWCMKVPVTCIAVVKIPCGGVWGFLLIVLGRSRRHHSQEEWALRL